MVHDWTTDVEICPRAMRTRSMASFAMAYAVCTQKDYNQLAKAKRNAAQTR